MNNLDLQYQALLQDILDNGVEKKDRTGTGTFSVFGRQIRHNMKDGFPLLTTKKMAWKTMVVELLWFLRGDTNIKYLVDNGCGVWNGDAYKRYYNSYPNVEKEFQYEGSNIEVRKMTQEEFINRIKTDDEFAKKWGELGPIYGKQWRSWTKKKMYLSTDGSYENIYDEADQTVIDQIANLINELKTNPDSRRLMVNAWNVGELDQMVLPPCHYGFQVYTRELSTSERMEYYSKHYMKEDETMSFDDLLKVIYDKGNIPTRAISLMWNQRSVDTFLGLPFNIASYGLLLMMIADEVNMVPDELIGNLGDVHLYLNHIEQAKEQIGREMTWEEQVQWVMKNTDVELENLYIVEEIAKDSTPKRTREPHPLPTVHVRDGIHCSSINDIILENYQSHPPIKAPLSN